MVSSHRGRRPGTFRAAAHSNNDLEQTMSSLVAHARGARAGA